MRQLRSHRRTTRVSCSNSLAKTQKMTAVIQYILTSVQSFGSQDYYSESLMTRLGLAGVLFCKMSRHGQNGLSFVPRKILTWVPRGATGRLKAIAGKRQQPYCPLSFLLLFVSFSQSVVFPTWLCLKPF